MNDQEHQSDPRVLNRRTLEHDHRHLATILEPGMTVLDVGCGTGAITAGIAKSIGPQGSAVGVDRDDGLLVTAREAHGGIENLSFETRDVLSLDYADCFDVVTAARTLQWVSDADLAVREMQKAARIGGRVIALDYNHELNAWEPGPPTEFVRFYAAFLEWRTANGWSNRMADELSGHFHNAGIAGVRTHVADEVVERDDPDFSGATALWLHVIETVGPRIVAAGNLSDDELLCAGDSYRNYVRNILQRQTLYLRTVEGVRVA